MFVHSATFALLRLLWQKFRMNNPQQASGMQQVSYVLTEAPLRCGES